jgi:hypothetical protein
VNHVHELADDFSQHVKAAMIFNEYVDIKKGDKEGPTEGYAKSDIRMLQELVAKLMELAQEAGEDMDKDGHQEDEGKRNVDHPQVANGGEQMKDLTLVQ